MTSKARLLSPDTLPIRAIDGGHLAEGPGFYIWDEDPSEVRRVARSFARGIYDVAPTARLLVVFDDLDPGAVA